MSRAEAVVDAITGYSKVAIALMVLLTVLIGAGASQVEQTTSLEEFQSDTSEAEDLEYIQTHFSTGSENTTTAQIVVRDGNVLAKSSLVEMLRYQRALREDPTVDSTLVENSSTTGIANVLATASIQQERGARVEATLAEFRRLNGTVQEQRAQLEEERAALQQNRSEFNQTRQTVAARAEALNATAGQLREALTVLREDPSESIRDQFDGVDESAPVTLNETDYEQFRTAAQELRNATDQQSIESAYQLGSQGVLTEEYAALESQRDALDQWGQDLQSRSESVQTQAQALAEQVEQLQTLGDRLEEQRAALENASSPPLEQQIDQIESMNATQLEAVVELVLSENSNGEQNALGFMSSDYEQGSTTAEATMMLVTQRTETAVAPGGTASDKSIDAQLAIQDLDTEFDSEYLVFGNGVISDEINRSMTDSMLIVGPMAIVFVLLALAFGYRDVLDIVLGLVGIGAVLIWTFGFMGWADIAFNQIFIAVPVLLIGLSIDYAIHIFMRHREERAAGEDLAPRESMRTALAGVGIALSLVTATTVIGFLSNYTSPVPPIRDFGLVSAVGITAALLVFGVLVPALKVELDEVLERYGFDRRKRAIGTSGGPLSKALKVGSIGARKAPYAVIVLALLLSAGGAYGGTQVDTTFAQEDFLAEEPPAWMNELPAPFQPGEYTAKQNLEYVNERFVREDSRAQLLIEGDLTTPEAISRIDQAKARLAEQDVTQKLSSGEADIQSPLTVMESVAATNESFNATFRAADTDSDGIPDANVSGVYAELFEVAPDQAGSVLYRTDGEYEAARIVVSISGGAASGDVTEQLQTVADAVTGDDIEVVATGESILFDIVQDQLLETVIKSLLITLVAVFLFLMIVYRISDGSATLGFVTLLPVVLSVAWILGTMYVMDIPFNVMTGMITSLTVGLGVAYSIHLSERYNQELDRSATVWDALDRAVTGTGGALLGSAATTVGGFGVLVFAILPALQQFGLITGLTIIYAFLASVLVLPSLLVLWTRLIGPESFVSGEGDAEDSPAPPEMADEPAGAVGTAAVADPGEPKLSAVRVVAMDRLTPGDTTLVTVRAEGITGRIALNERFDGGTIELRTARPAPTAFAVRSDLGYVLWEGVSGSVEIEYEVTVDDDVTHGSRLHFDGAVVTKTADVTIGGDDAITVVSDFASVLENDGPITETELQMATEHFAAGRLTDSEFEKICWRWVEDDE
ncbi:MAG: MMPL family transporter [archaeon]